MINNNAMILNRKILILLLLLFSLLIPLISETVAQEPVYFIDNNIDRFTNVIYQDDQIYALGSKWSKLYFYCFDEDLHLKFKKKITDSSSEIFMMPYKKGFLITISEYRTSEIIHISKKGKVINSLDIEGSIKDCCINNDQIFLFIHRIRQFFLLAEINEDFEVLLSDSIELSKTGALKLFLTEMRNYIVTLDIEASIYTFDKMWNFIDKKTIAECDWHCNYQLEIWNEQIIIYPQKATWLTKPQKYTDYEGQPLKDQVQYFDLEGNLLKVVDIPRYRGFSSELDIDENMYIQQSENLKTLYLVSSMGDIVREANFDFSFTMRDYAILPDDKYIIAGDYTQNKSWAKHGLIILSQFPDEKLSFFPMTEDALTLESAFETNDNEMLSELMEKWYRASRKPKTKFCRKWEKEAYDLYQAIFPLTFDRIKHNCFPGYRSPYFEPIYQLIPSHLTVEISESIYAVDYPASSYAPGTDWRYQPTEIRHEITDFRPDINIIPLDLKFIYSTDEISQALSGFLALSETDNLNLQREVFLKYYISLSTRNKLGKEPRIYGYYDYPCIIFDRKYQKAIIRPYDGDIIRCVKEAGVWKYWHGKW